MAQAHAPIEGPLVSVIIPVLRDTEELAALLPTLPRDSALETLVVDGSPGSDPPMRLLREAHRGVRWIDASQGRAKQMNAGAEQARGDWLVFLHADTRLANGWLDAIRALVGSGVIGGSFRFALDAPGWRARAIEWGVAFRVRWFGLPYGDQALFVRRDVFEQMDGYRPLPLMEDVDFVRRLRRRGPLRHVAVAAVTSARRYARDGWAARVAGNAVLLTLFLAGFPPARLAALYHRRAS